MINIRHGIVLNGRLVPTASRIAKILDPFSLTDAGVEDVEVNVVDFLPAAYSMCWLIGPKGLVPKPTREWWAYVKDIPLLNEIKGLVMEGRDILTAKKKKGIANMRDSFVLVQVRGRNLLVANKPRRGVALALTSLPRVGAGSLEDEAGTLSWFPKELKNDIETLRTEPEEDEMVKAIKAGLVVLRASSEVRRATWRPPQNAFRVTKKNQKNVKTFKVPAPKTGKTQKAAIDKVVADALRWAERFAGRRAERGD